jgi:hypothetical protein
MRCERYMTLEVKKQAKKQVVIVESLVKILS